MGEFTIKYLFKISGHLETRDIWATILRITQTGDVPMDQIREVFIKFANFAIIASLFPIIVLFIAALFIDRARRILLFLVVVLLIVTLFLAYTFITHDNLQINEIGDLWFVLLDSIRTLAPTLIILMVVVVGLVIASPYLVRWVDQMARTNYLEQVIENCKNRTQGYVNLDSRAEVLLPVKGSKLVIGESGSGKTMLLYTLMANMAEQALVDPRSPFPIWVDIDRLLVQNYLFDKLPFRLSKLQSYNGLLLERVFGREAIREQLCFFIDCSASTLSLMSAYQFYTLLVRVMQILAPNSFVVSLPDSPRELDILPHFSQVTTLSQLDDAELFKMLRVRDPRPGVTGELRGIERGWNNLVRRPFLLNLFAFYVKQTGNIPTDLRDLFKVTVYPPGVSEEKVEQVLCRLAAELARSGHYWLPKKQVVLLVKDISGGNKILSMCEGRGLLVGLEAVDGNQLDSFSHPLYLAYFIALAWLRTGHLGARIDEIENNPILADAWVFFNNLDSDYQRFSDRLMEIAMQGDLAAQQLAVKCLLAMPQDERIQQVVEQVCLSLVQADDFPSGGRTSQNAWLLLKTLSPQERVRVYEKAVEKLNEYSQLAVLHHLAVITSEGERKSGDLAEILQLTHEPFAALAVKAWADMDPDQTLIEVCALYQNGPQERAGFAIAMLGNLPHDGADRFLRDLLNYEQQPELRIEIIRSLINQGQKGLFGLLLNIVRDNREAEPVRVAAAELLSFSDLPVLPAGMAELRDLVRASHQPLPAPAKTSLQILVDQLRRQYSNQVSIFESLANPYFVNRPASDPNMFFGRTTLMHTLLGAVENGNDVLIFGGRRVGKTSLLKQLQIAIQDTAYKGIPWRVVMVDAEEIDEDQFYYRLAASVLSQLDDPMLPIEPSYQLPYQESGFQQDMTTVVSSLKKNQGEAARLVVLVDNASEILRFSPELLKSLARVISSDMLAASLVLILATDQELPEGHPLSSFFVSYQVANLDQNDAVQLITQPVEGILTYERGAIDLIQQISQGHPQTIQFVCQKLVNRVQALGKDNITENDVRSVVWAADSVSNPRSDIIIKSSSLLGDLMDWLDANPNAPKQQLEERIKQVFDGLRNVIITQVLRTRQAKSENSSS